MPAEYYVDYRWFLERQEELLDDLAVNDYSVFVGLAARHKVDPPRHDQHRPDAFWRAAVMLEECVMLRPLPTRNELYGYTVALAYLSMHDEQVSTKFEVWRELIADIRALRVDSYSIAERLRSLRLP
ncbi:toxin Doc [Streptomyces rochei]|uniref:toxin Doc n=1 Tax=Streptomyces rochei TaxID=1928 RepID=UPI002ACD4449|nr:toxin Doc [Streptomyces rochei]WQC10369.1 toxin Doc [Streptomyces rochei]WQC17306.1 toxin Doc [Streptomyces rochei]